MASLPNQDGHLAYFLRRLVSIPPFTPPTSPPTVLLIGANTGIGLAAAEILLSPSGLENLLLRDDPQCGKIPTDKTAPITLLPGRRQDRVFQARLIRLLFRSRVHREFEWDELHINRVALSLAIAKPPPSRFLLPLLLLLLPNTPDYHSVHQTATTSAPPLSTLLRASDTGILSYLNNPTHYSHNTAYLTSKLLGILFARALSEKLNPAEILNMVNPGVARTALFRDRWWWFRLSVWFLGRSVHVAAGVVIQGALGDEGVVHGGFSL
ncbi:hypothetical protein L873DRAFT_1845690 [Choiromyces venosus 120613-1]|uniref:NAD(P)-binding protein n=1 Tax=Choiromyces venosus 120613-1 TaxID=1336337 RepID=A0A3N4JC44_9PEZI|nr:hypothetical protein L873DRAFT_1845690 [Choiromyces venosus 120613-1]